MTPFENKKGPLGEPTQDYFNDNRLSISSQVGCFHLANFRFSTSNLQQNPYVTNFAQKNIRSIEEFLEALKYDHAPGVFKDGQRNKENWRGSDLVVIDVDDGLTITEFEAKFKERYPEVGFVIKPSRNHQREKHGKTCDRFHVYILVSPCFHPDIIEQYSELVKRLAGEFGADQNATDPARFFFGSDGEALVYDGKKLDWKKLIPHRAEEPKHNKQQHHQERQERQGHETLEEERKLAIRQWLPKLKSQRGGNLPLDNYAHWIDAGIILKRYGFTFEDFLTTCWDEIDTEEARRKWDSFDEAPPSNGHPLTIATLIKFIKEVDPAFESKVDAKEESINTFEFIKILPNGVEVVCHTTGRKGTLLYESLTDVSLFRIAPLPVWLRFLRTYYKADNSTITEYTYLTYAKSWIMEHCTQSDQGPQLKNFDELTNEEIDWIVHPIIPQSGLGLIVGKSGSYKSFVAVDLAYSISNQLPAFGELKTKKGKVVYCVGEGIKLFRNRFLPLIRERGGNTENLLFVEGAFSLVSDVDKFIANMKAKSPEGISVIIFDTLRTFFEGDENNSTEVNYLIRAAQKITEETGALVLFVHHPPKGNDKEIRGSSVIRGAMDFIIGVSTQYKGSYVKLECLKMKDAIEFRFINLRVKSVYIGNSQKTGKSLSSVILTYEGYSDYSEDEILKPGTKAFIAYERLKEIYRKNGGKPIQQSPKLYEDLIYNKKPMSSKDWSEALNTLREKNLIILKKNSQGKIETIELIGWHPEGDFENDEPQDVPPDEETIAQDEGNGDEVINEGTNNQTEDTNADTLGTTEEGTQQSSTKGENQSKNEPPLTNAPPDRNTEEKPPQTTHKDTSEASEETTSQHHARCRTVSDLETLTGFSDNPTTSPPTPMQSDVGNPTKSDNPTVEAQDLDFLNRVVLPLARSGKVTIEGDGLLIQKQDFLSGVIEVELDHLTKDCELGENFEDHVRNKLNFNPVEHNFITAPNIARLYGCGILTHEGDSIRVKEKTVYENTQWIFDNPAKTNAVTGSTPKEPPEQTALIMRIRLLWEKSKGTPIPSGEDSPLWRDPSLQTLKTDIPLRESTLHQLVENGYIRWFNKDIVLISGPEAVKYPFSPPPEVQDFGGIF